MGLALKIIHFERWDFLLINHLSLGGTPPFFRIFFPEKMESPLPFIPFHPHRPYGLHLEVAILQGAQEPWIQGDPPRETYDDR